MSKKYKHHGVAQLSLGDLKARAERASREGRFQQALELVKQVYKAEPTPQHQELLRKTYLGRARQLRNQSQVRDAITVLQVASQLAHPAAGGDASGAVWLDQLAEEFAACGEVRRAMELLRGQPDSLSYARVMGQAVDAALQQAEAGRRLLPETMQVEFDCILRAFAQVEAAQDDQARETLQGIGLRSPFLEWKLLLRGLQAYWQKDDVRALENWQRLQPERLPARLAAPLRFLIDPAYRLAQAPEAQALLQKQADRLQGSGCVPQLRTIQASLAGQQPLASAYRLADTVVPSLRAEAGHLVPRLAACYFWAIVTKGEFEDVFRHQRVFGTPADDPKLHRLHAMAAEHVGDLENAHTYWQEFEKAAAGHPADWPGEQANRVRALIWNHMGHNAASIPDGDKLKGLPPFLRDHPSRPKPLSPSAEKCFERAIELAPDRLEGHEALFRFYDEKDKETKAIKAGKHLLERFPDHVPTLEALGDLYMRQEDYSDGLALFQRALKLNPLDRDLRYKVSTAHVFNARSLAERGQFDEARAEYEACLAYEDVEGDRSSIYCKWAACEYKANDPTRAEELLQQALSKAGNRLAVAFSMLIETIRLKLPRALKNRFDKEFKEALAEPPTGAGAAAVAVTTSHHILAGVNYYGQKTHEKKVHNYLDQARHVDFSESQLEKICGALLIMKSSRLMGRYTEMGQKRFPSNPHFYLIEAQSYLLQGPMQCPVWKVRPLLEKARQLLEKMPPDDKQKRVLESVQEQLEALDLFNPFMRGGPMGMFDDIFDGYDGEDDEDYDPNEGWDY